MGGLAHYLEAAGIPTTQISLVRLHTEKTRPPRALWVPFELGRPFGPPDAPAFQRRVVHAALSLLERDAGPVLEDFPEEAPAAAADDAGWACPVNFSPPTAALEGPAAQAAAVAAELARLAPWYDRAREARGRTTFGVSELDVEAIPEFLASMLEGPLPEPPVSGVALVDALRLAAEDLKAWYYEAATAQPGAASPAELSDWFWHQTEASALLRAVKQRCLDSGSVELAFLGRALMVPAHQA